MVAIFLGILYLVFWMLKLRFSAIAKRFGSQLHGSLFRFSSSFGEILARECRQTQREELRAPQDADQVAGDQPGPARPQRGLLRPRRICPSLSSRKTVSLNTI